jgi:hypothetical protein
MSAGGAKQKVPLKVIVHQLVSKSYDDLRKLVETYDSFVSYLIFLISSLDWLNIENVPLILLA